MRAAVAAPTLFDPLEELSALRQAATVKGHRTLDEVVTEIWAEIVAHGTAMCPICGGELRRVGRTPGGSVGGAAICGECRTEIT